jgi:hypothetical protein
VLEVLKGTSRVETLRACKGAHTNLIALTKFHITTELLETLICVLIARVNNPSVSLHENGRSQIVLRVPPVRGAGRLTASTEHALVETIEKFTVLNWLKEFTLPGLLPSLPLKIGLNWLVLSVEVRHIDHEILKDEHEHERRDCWLLCIFLVNRANACQMVTAINIHCTWATNALSAAATERKGGINFVLDFNQSIEEHGSALVRIDVVADILGAVSGVIRVSAIDVEALHRLLLILRETLVELDSVIYLEDVRNISNVCVSANSLSGSRSEDSELVHSEHALGSSKEVGAPRHTLE